MENTLSIAETKNFGLLRVLLLSHLLRVLIQPNKKPSVRCIGFLLVLYLLQLSMAFYSSSKALQVYCMPKKYSFPIAMKGS
jgi:hypothetical protein